MPHVDDIPTRCVDNIWRADDNMTDLVKDHGTRVVSTEGESRAEGMNSRLLPEKSEMGVMCVDGKLVALITSR